MFQIWTIAFVLSDMKFLSRSYVGNHGNGCRACAGSVAAISSRPFHRAHFFTAVRRIGSDFLVFSQYMSNFGGGCLLQQCVVVYSILNRVLVIPESLLVLRKRASSLLCAIVCNVNVMEYAMIGKEAFV